MNRVELAVATKGVLIGAGCMVPSPLIAEVVAASGVDYVSADQQHGLMDNTLLLSMLQAIEGRGRIPLTRVPANHPDAVMRACDFGAAGVIVPLVESEASARQAVAACRFPPRGNRSFGPIRPGIDGRRMSLAELEEVACFVLIETAAGVNVAEEIAAVPGLDGIYVGPNDLALGLGIYNDPEWRSSTVFIDALKRIQAACRNHGVIAGIGLPDARDVATCVELGYQMVGIGYDLPHLRTMLRQLVDNARSTLDVDGAALRKDRDGA